MKASSSEVAEIGYYIPSYKRADAVTTLDWMPYATLVVRESEASDYREHNPEAKILPVEDSQICSAVKVRNWILDNAPEDLIVQCDDDVDVIEYCNHQNQHRLTNEDLLMECERVAVMIDDLHLGYGAVSCAFKPMAHEGEFTFNHSCGVLSWYDKRYLKARYDEGCELNDDLDFALQELLYNRIFLCVEYIYIKAGRDTNPGGNSVNKSRAMQARAREYMKQKWGDAFDMKGIDGGGGVHIKVKR